MNYLVIGGSSGIGLELVGKLQDTGASVWVASRSWNKAVEFPHVRHIQWDVTKEELDTTNLPDTLHGMAYCPGTINLKPIKGLKLSDFQLDFEVNVLGLVKAVQAVLPLLKNAPQASLVTFSTVAVTQGMPFHASIAAAKGAVEGLSRSLAAELAPSIRVNCIAPSLTDTPLASRLLTSTERRDASAQRHPLKKIGTAAEVAQLAYYLLSEQSAWLSGQVIHIDGGMSALRTA